MDKGGPAAAGRVGLIMARIVIIADHDRARREAIVKLLCDEYDIECLDYGGWDELQAAQAEATTSGIVWHAVILSSILPGITKQGFLGKLQAVFEMPPVEQAETKTVVVFLKPSQPKIEVYPHQPFWISSEPGRLDEDIKHLLIALGPVLRSSPPLPKVTWDRSDLILAQQLRMLNPKGEPGSELRVLQRLLQKFREVCQHATIQRLTPGYSGSLVFCVRWHADKSPGQTIDPPEQTMLMKISRYDDLWKIRRTFEDWDVIEKSLNPSGLEAAVPQPLKPDQKEGQVGYLVEAGGFVAEFWQYLSKPIGQFDDWEHVHWSANGRSRKSKKLIESVIELLRASWYDDATWTGELPLWTAEDMKHPANVSFPPYGLTSWWKAKILSSLGDLERLGERMSPDNWKSDCTAIRDWIIKGPNPRSIVTAPGRVLLSKIHGDLNKNNILWWGEKKRPLLIDFATFQQSAHTLQDFAELETQAQYALMDRQNALDVDPIDYCAQQFVEWSKRLTDLVPALPGNLRSFTCVASNEKNIEGMKQAETLIGLIRCGAHAVFDAAVGRSGAPAFPGRFCQEYATALLYHTIRAIGYENSLSPFKRMLAVHSAARLIARLG